MVKGERETGLKRKKRLRRDGHNVHHVHDDFIYDHDHL